MEQEDIGKLLKALDTVCNLCRPVVFKHLSAAGVSEEEMKNAFSTIEELKNKYN